jgi:hypothetical protein
MASRRRIVSQTETYRFSATPTISDYPLLIGELLRRSELRGLQAARMRALIGDMVAAFGWRTHRRLGDAREAFGRRFGIIGAPRVAGTARLTNEK